MLIIFIHARIWPEFPFPILGSRLNNPFMFLLTLLVLRGWVNTGFREKQLAFLTRITTEEPLRVYFFSLLILMQFGLQVMWFLYPWDFFWNLNAEKGYGTLFATAQLFDECVGIHENFIAVGGKIALESVAFHFIHEWLWFYAPIALVAAVILARFFLKRFSYSPRLMSMMFIALTLWVGVLVLEALSKKLVDPLSYDYTRILIGIEEGFEMLGATLFMIGFSKHLKNLQEKSRGNS